MRAYFSTLFFEKKNATVIGTFGQFCSTKLLFCDHAAVLHAELSNEINLLHSWDLGSKRVSVLSMDSTYAHNVARLPKMAYASTSAYSEVHFLICCIVVLIKFEV